MKSGCSRSAFTLATASRKVARASALGGLLKPIWLSLICRNVKEAARDGRTGAASAASRPIELPTPPLNANNAPVPAHAMHFRKSRRLSPSPLSIDCPFIQLSGERTRRRANLFPLQVVVTSEVQPSSSANLARRFLTAGPTSAALERFVESAIVRSFLRSFAS